MSGTIGDTGASLANEARDTTGRLLDAQGNEIDRARATAEGALDQIGTYVREQPFSTALIALGIGYIIGRLRII